MSIHNIQSGSVGGPSLVTATTPGGKNPLGLIIALQILRSTYRNIYTRGGWEYSKSIAALRPPLLAIIEHLFEHKNITQVLSCPFPPDSYCLLAKESAGLCAQPHLPMAALRVPGKNGSWDDSCGFGQYGPLKVLAMADGIGSRSNSNIASRLAIKLFLHVLSQLALNGRMPDEEILRDLCTFIHVFLLVLAAEVPQYNGLTTFEGLVISGGNAIAVKAGDTRTYMFCDNQLFLVMPDDSTRSYEAARDINRGKPIGVFLSSERGRLEQYYVYMQNGNPFTKIPTSGLGVDPQHQPQISTVLTEISPGTWSMLCTDGCHGIPFPLLLQFFWEHEASPTSQFAEDFHNLLMAHVGSDEASMVVCKE